jgi:hypothetical protein
MPSLLRTILPVRAKQVLKGFYTFVSPPFAARHVWSAKAPDAQRIEARKRFAMSYFEEALARIESWAPMETEDENFYYELTPLNRQHLAHLISLLSGASLPAVETVFRELDNHQILRRHLLDGVKRLSGLKDVRIAYGRRLGWYAMVRLLKPATIVETGVDRGVGSCVLCAALMRNAEEGHRGRYFGTELRAKAGELFTGPYAAFGQILYGDSLESLAAFDRPIDLFINDSDHSADYEYREYVAIKDKLSPAGVILGDNCHVTDRLSRFSAETGRPFVFFRESPADHWYPGAGIGFSMPRSSRTVV